jgi:single-strand DNA-binding protein
VTDIISLRPDLLTPMNSCILTAEIIKNPELRYTADNQTAVADMFVRFTPPIGSKDDAPKPTIEVVAWGNLGVELKESYKLGDVVAIEGRLEMNTFEREGYKEKRGRLVASRIHRLAAAIAPLPVVEASATKGKSKSTKAAPVAEVQESIEDVDLIPF